MEIEMTLGTDGQITRLREDLEACTAERADLAADRERLQAEAIRLRQEQIRQIQTQRLLEYEIQDLRNSVSYRLGHALVLSLKSPRGFRRLPGDIVKLYREGRAKRPKNSRSIGKEQRYGRLSPKESGRLTAVYQEGGVDAVRDDILTRHKSDARSRTDALLGAGYVLAEAGYRAVAVPLVTEAVRQDRSERTLGALFWASQKEGDFLTAGRCFLEIEELLRDGPSAEQRRFFERLRNSPAHIVSAAARIPPRAERGAYSKGRICYVLHNSWPYASGGYATRAHGLAVSLQKAGWEIIALTRPGFPLDAKPGLLARDVPLSQTHEGIEYRTLLEPERHSLSRRDYMLVAADRIETALRDIRPEFVIAASAHLSALPALIAARRLGIPFIYEVRGFMEVTRKSREPSLEDTVGYRVDVALETITAQEADHVFTLTEPMREELVARGVESPIDLLPNSCDPDRFRPLQPDTALAARLGIPPGTPVIGYIGTFVQYEGLEHLARACANLWGRGMNFRLLLVGSEHASRTGGGSITTEILDIVAAGGLSDRLIMPGRVPHEEVEAYYSLIDIAPFPRKPQPVTEMVSPMKPLEAMAMEKAVIVSSVRALTEMVHHGKTGLVFEKGDIDGLTDALAQLIDDPGLREDLGKAARRWVVEKRTWDRTADLALRRLERLRRSAESRSSDIRADPAASPGM
jgi:glycosyltransferase involved in cell wall biosynthesis